MKQKWQNCLSNSNILKHKGNASDTLNLLKSKHYELS
nr:MAG TPA: hypothetical protein [Caudoviricetes sp.]